MVPSCAEPCGSFCVAFNGLSAGVTRRRFPGSRKKIVWRPGDSASGNCRGCKFTSKQRQAMSKRFFSAGCVLAAVIVLAAGLAGVGLRASSGAADKPNSWGFDTANLDKTCKTCKPCDDFYPFPIGGWVESNPNPTE